MDPKNAQTIASFLLDGMEQEHKITKKVLSAVPDSKFSWRPHEKGRPVGELAWHIPYSEVFFLEVVAAGEFLKYDEGKPPARVADIVATYEARFAQALAKVRALPPEALVKMITYPGAFTLPAFAYLSLVSNHSIHHRGQLSAYLRAMGEKVPAIYGGSADEAFAKSA